MRRQAIRNLGDKRPKTIRLRLIAIIHLFSLKTMQIFEHISVTFLSVAASLSASILFTASALRAQPQANCLNPTSNIEYKFCAYQDYLSADRRLNQVYQQITSSLSGGERQHLVEAQLAWIKFRDANCNFEVYRNLGGTGYGGFLSNCLTRMTRARTVELQKWHSAPN